MKKLLLLRHAKASQDMAGGDHARRLAPRGRRDAPAMGEAMKSRGLVPDHVLCSPAARTRETWELVAPQLGIGHAAEFPEALYLASWKTILARIQAAPAEAATLMVVGHNPGLADCAAALLCHEAGPEERHRRVELAEKFPTCALAAIDLPVTDWDAVSPGAGSLTQFLKPREL